MLHRAASWSSARASAILFAPSAILGQWPGSPCEKLALSRKIRSQTFFPPGRSPAPSPLSFRLHITTPRQIATVKRSVSAGSLDLLERDDARPLRRAYLPDDDAAVE